MWKNLRDLVFGGIFSKVLLGISTVFIINTLSKTDYAQVNNFLFVQSLVAGWIFSPFLAASVVMANVHNLHNPKRLFVSLNVLQVYCVVALIAIAIAWGPGLSVVVFHKPVYFWSILLGLCASIFLTFQNIVLSQHQAKESFAKYNLVSILRPFFLAVSLFLLWIFDWFNFYTVSVAFLFSIVLSVANEFDFIAQGFSLKGLKIKLSQFKWFWKSARYLVLFFFVRGSIDHIALFFVSRYFSVEDFANFSVAFRYYAFFDLILYSAHIAFLNSFTKYSFSESKAKFVSWVKLTVPVSAAGIVVLIFGEPLFTFVNGVRYSESYPIFASYMVGFTVYLCFSPVIYGLARQDRFRTLFILSLLGALVQLVVTFFGVAGKELVLISAAAVAGRGFIYLASTFLYFRRA